MSDTRNLFLKLFTFIVIVNVILYFFNIGVHWQLSIWIMAAIVFVFVILPVLGIPLYWLYQGYRMITNEGMRFIQGVGLALILIGTYMAIYETHNPQYGSVELRQWLSSLGLSSGRWFTWWATGMVFLIIGLIPPLASFLFGLWMKLADGLHFVMSRVVLTIAFILTVLPVGFLAKLTGKRFLDRHLDRDQKSYWKDRPDTSFNAANYRKQF